MGRPPIGWPVAFERRLFPERLADVGGHSRRPSQLSPYASQRSLLAPLSKIRSLFFVNIDPVSIPVIAFRCVISHSLGLLFCCSTRALSKRFCYFLFNQGRSSDDISFAARFPVTKGCSYRYFPRCFLGKFLSFERARFVAGDSDRHL